MSKVTILSEQSAQQYFEYIFNLESSGISHPVDFDAVWPLCYTRKDIALDALKANFIEGMDYNLRQKAEVLTFSALQAGIKVDIELSVGCLEWFIVRKLRSIFECYQNMRKLIQSGQFVLKGGAEGLTRHDILKMALESEEERLRLAEENDKQHIVIDLQTRELQDAAPKVNYYNDVLQSKSTYKVNQVAKELGMSAVTLNKLLHAQGIQYKQSNTWLLYAKHQGKGWTKTETTTYTNSQGHTDTSMLTVWTETGRKFIHELIASLEEDAA